MPDFIIHRTYRGEKESDLPIRCRSLRQAASEALFWDYQFIVPSLENSEGRVWNCDELYEILLAS